ncbi:MAG: hypothetical protein KF729_06160 [Sandaracinaceae bacterium]|nr:hypothetical protein [Sandaracinaceae bacterium]
MLLARVEPAGPAAGPFRTEPRARARHVLAVAASPRALATRLRAQTRAWLAYVLALALGAGALVLAASYDASPDHSVGAKVYEA